MTKTVDTLIEGLIKASESASAFEKSMAEAKSLRQPDNPEGRTDLYIWSKPEETLEGKAAHLIQTIKLALEETMKRYPEAHNGLAFFMGASGLAGEEPTQENIDWAKSVIPETTS